MYHLPWQGLFCRVKIYSMLEFKTRFPGIGTNVKGEEKKNAVEM